MALSILSYLTYFYEKKLNSYSFLLCTNVIISFVNTSESKLKKIKTDSLRVTASNQIPLKQKKVIKKG